MSKSKKPDEISGLTTARVVLRGVLPFLMRNNQGADPLNRFAKALKVVSKKRDKTEEDHLFMGPIEWWSSLYTSPPPDEAIDLDSHGNASAKPYTSLVIPSNNIRSLIVEGARKRKLGKQAEAGVTVESDGEFRHDGPSDLNDLAADRRFTDRRPVGNKTATVMRTRPIFRTWAVEFTLFIDPELIEPAAVRQALDMAGRMIGLGDYRPLYGRFSVETFEVSE